MWPCLRRAGASSYLRAPFSRVLSTTDTPPPLPGDTQESGPNPAPNKDDSAGPNPNKDDSAGPEKPTIVYLDCLSGLAEVQALFETDSGPTAYEVYKARRLGLPVEECIGMRPPTASDYVDDPEDPADEVHEDPHDEDSYSESEDYGIDVSEGYRSNRKLLRVFRIRNRIWKAIERQRARKYSNPK